MDRLLRSVKSVPRPLAMILAGGGLVGGLGMAKIDVNHYVPDMSTYRIVRFGRAAAAVVWIVIDYKLTMRSIDESDSDYWNVRSQLHLRSAERLRDVCCQNGGMFIKVGQHLGAMDYLLPKEYVQTFKKLHSEAPEMPLYQLKQVIQEELGVPAEELFETLYERPLGAASLAQCHKAKLKDGQLLAIKVQFPSVQSNSLTDTRTMEFLVACVSYIFPGFHFEWLVTEIKQNLPKELNFKLEGQNIEKFAAMFKHLKFVKTPKVYWDMTTERVLTMEYMEGVKVDNRLYMEVHDISTHEVSKKISKLYSEMIFFRGYIHCDPHPGNVLVRKGSEGKVEVVLLDHGLYTQLSEDFRLTYCRLWMAILRQDLDGVKRYTQLLNGGELYPLLASIITARSWDSISKGVSWHPFTKTEGRRIQKYAVEYFPQITQLLNTVPRELLLILKTNDLIRCIEHSLGTWNNKWGFMEMSFNCIQALGDYHIRSEVSWHGKLYRHLEMKLQLLGLWLYKLWTTLSNRLT